MEFVTRFLRSVDDLLNIALNIPHSDIQLGHYHPKTLRHGSSYAFEPNAKM
ncbi:hypothetical protein D3C85_1596580 [compost metagenome]